MNKSPKEQILIVYINPLKSAIKNGTRKIKIFKENPDHAEVSILFPGRLIESCTSFFSDNSEEVTDNLRVY